MAFGECDQPNMPKASQASHAADYSIIESLLPKQVFESFARARRNIRLHLWQCIHLLPKRHRIAQLVHGELPQPLVLFFQHERSAVFREGLSVAIEDCLARRFRLQSKVPFVGGQDGASRQSH